MLDDKVVIINGNTDEKRKLNDGEIERVGNIFSNDLHIEVLLEYIRKKYDDIEYLKQLTIRHQPEIAAYFLTRFGSIVFLNTTKNVKKYGKRGALFLPNFISEKQKETLYEFCKEINDYSLVVFYELNLHEGFLDGKQMIGSFEKSPIELIDSYFIEKERENNKYK